MSRSKRKTPIVPVTTADSEAWDKGKWHRRHRREERARLKADAESYVPRSHRQHSNPWRMEKDGRIYWGSEADAKDMRK